VVGRGTGKGKTNWHPGTGNIGEPFCRKKNSRGSSIRKKIRRVRGKAPTAKITSAGKNVARGQKKKRREEGVGEVEGDLEEKRN